MIFSLKSCGKRGRFWGVMKFLMGVVEMFNWEGRYKRWSFFWRYALLSSILRTINDRWDRAVLKSFTEGEVTLSVVNYVTCWQCVIAMFLLAPCVMKRMRDSGYRSFWWFLGWAAFIPQQIIVLEASEGWKAFNGACCCVCVVAFITCFIALLSGTKITNEEK